MDIKHYFRASRAFAWRTSRAFASWTSRAFASWTSRAFASRASRVFTATRARDELTHAWRRVENFGAAAWRASTIAVAAQKAPFAVLALGTCLVAAMIWTTPAYRGGDERAPIDAQAQGVATLAVAQSKISTEVWTKPQGVIVISANTHDLYKDFRRIGYRLEDVRSGDGTVPRVFVKAMPRDIGKVSSIATRKAVFIQTMLPLVLRANEELRAIRAKVLALTARDAQGQALTSVERSWLAAQYARFGVSPNNRAGLLLRIDVIPPSMALAQGAEESGWGSSRFALEGRALFGQRTNAETPGLVPVNRAAGARFKVKRFGHLLEGVRSYAQNLNTHRAYARFRVHRARMRAQAGGSHGLDANRLVDTLVHYSERGADYIETIKTIIRVNDFRALDGARLSLM